MMTAEERLEFLLNRQSGIGSSDAPDLCGVGWGDAKRVYRSKVEPVTLYEAAQPMNGYLERGIVLEPIVAAKYTREMGCEVQKVPSWSHPDRPWQAASVDFEASDGSRDVECKTVAGFGDEWGESGTDYFPENYRVQCQHQMGVRGRPYMDLAALDVISWSLRVYRLEFSPTFFEWLTDIEEMFWEKVVARAGIEPGWERQWEAATIELIEQASPHGKLDSSTVPLLERRKIFSDIEKEAKEEKEALTEEIKARMGDMRKAEVDGWKVQRVFYKKAIIPEYERAEFYQLRTTPPKEPTFKKGKKR